MLKLIILILAIPFFKPFEKYVVEIFVTVILNLFEQIAGCNLLDYKPAQNQTLGASGLALHYANIINQIDNIVSIPGIQYVFYH